MVSAIAYSNAKPTPKPTAAPSSQPSVAEIRHNYSAAAAAAIATAAANGGGATHLTLGDWIGRVRCKRRSARRKNANLRIAAVLEMALRSAETELKVRQQQRAAKWATLNQQIERNNRLRSRSPPPRVPDSVESSDDDATMMHEDSEEEEEEEDNTGTGQQTPPPQQRHMDIGGADAEQLELQQRTDDELWRNELSGLDQFINRMNQVKTCVVR